MRDRRETDNNGRRDEQRRESHEEVARLYFTTNKREFESLGT